MPPGSISATGGWYLTIPASATVPAEHFRKMVVGAGFEPANGYPSRFTVCVL